MQSAIDKIVVLGTGGTIAGTAASAAAQVGYAAAQLGVEALVQAVPALADRALESEQVAQVDSKDMDVGTWLALARRAAHHLSRQDVAGLVVTHGTDTLEETAWFLHRVLAPAKPVVLTAAMRPATALDADGPRNLLDAVAVASAAGPRGVVAVLHGRVHAAADVLKLHPHRVDAFGSGESGPLAVVEEGRLRRFRDWPTGEALGLPPADPAQWPRVAVVASHAGADGRVVELLCADGVDGIVVAGTGNGTVHRTLLQALQQARDQGVAVWRSTRCPFGVVVEDPRDEGAWPPCTALSPAKARIELMLRLMQPGVRRP